MASFIDELNEVSRTNSQIEIDNEALRKQNIYDSMMVPENVLQEFDENFLKALKSNIKTKAYNAEYEMMPDGKRRLESYFSYRQKYRIGMGVDYFEGFTFPKRHGGKTNMTCEIHLLATEKTTKKRLLCTVDGTKYYINEPLLEHIKKLVEDQGITITHVDGWPPIGEFISDKKLIKKYTEISVDFHYEILY